MKPPHHVLCVVKVGPDGFVDKASMDAARKEVAEVMDYTSEKLLAELGKKQVEPGDLAAFRVELDVKFGVVDQQGKGVVHGKQE